MGYEGKILAFLLQACKSQNKKITSFNTFVCIKKKDKKRNFKKWQR